MTQFWLSMCQEHVFKHLPDEEYLERIGAAGYGEDGK